MRTLPVGRKDHYCGRIAHGDTCDASQPLVPSNGFDRIISKCSQSHLTGKVGKFSGSAVMVIVISWLIEASTYPWRGFKLFSIDWVRETKGTVSTTYRLESRKRRDRKSSRLGTRQGGLCHDRGRELGYDLRIASR